MLLNDTTAVIYVIIWIAAYCLAYKRFLGIQNWLTLVPLSFSTLLTINAFFYTFVSRMPGVTLDAYFYAVNALYFLGLGAVCLIPNKGIDWKQGETKLNRIEYLVVFLFVVFLTFMITKNSTSIDPFGDEWSYLSVMNRMADWNTPNPETVFTKKESWEAYGISVSKYLDHSWYAQIAAISRFFGVELPQLYFYFKLIMTPIILAAVLNFYFYLIKYENNYPLVLVAGLVLMMFLVPTIGNGGYHAAGRIMSFMGLFFTLKYLRTGVSGFLAATAVLLFSIALVHVIDLTTFTVYALYLVTADILHCNDLSLKNAPSAAKRLALELWIGIKEGSWARLRPYYEPYVKYASILFVIFVPLLFGKVYHSALGEVTGKWIAPYEYFMNYLVVYIIWPFLGFPYIVSILLLAYLIKKNGWNYVNTFLAASYLIFPVMLIPPVIMTAQGMVDIMVICRLVLSSCLYYFTIIEFLRDCLKTFDLKNPRKVAVPCFLMVLLFLSLSPKVSVLFSSVEKPAGPIYSESQFYVWSDFYKFVGESYVNKTILSDELTSTPIPAFTKNFVLIHRPWASDPKIYAEVSDLYKSNSTTMLDEFIEKYEIDVVVINGGSMPGLEDYNVLLKTKSNMADILESQPNKFRNVYRNGNITAYEVVSRMPPSS